MSTSPALPVIRPATIDDAAALAALGRRTFSDTFAADNTPENLAGFLDATYSEALQRDELAAPHLTYLVAGRDDGSLAGFALLRRGNTSTVVTDPSAIELQRLYVDRLWHGTGLAQALMAECRRVATDAGANAIWLGVWERNARALRFYEAQGFVAIGQQRFTVGSDPQTDTVMLCRLRA